MAFYPCNSGDGGSGSNNLIWKISDELYAESRDVSTLPRDITNGYVVKLNDIFYMLGGSHSAANVTYKYVNGSWVSDSTIGKLKINKNYREDYGANSREIYNLTNGGVVSNNKMIYFTEFNTTSSNTSNTGIVNTYNGTTKSTITQYFGPSNSIYARYGDIGVAVQPSSNIYRLLSLGTGDATDTSTSSRDYDGSLQIGSTTAGEYTTLDSTNFGGYSYSSYMSIVHPQGVYHNGYYVYLISKMTTSSTVKSSSTNLENTTFHYYLVLVTSVGKLHRTIEVPDGISTITDVVGIGDYIYFTNEHGLVTRWSYKTMKWETIFDIASNSYVFKGSLVEHDGEIHRFTGTTHTAHKLYRTAKTYAPKNTKIYLPYESAPISTNLQPIEGGYSVTESGNVEIKLYDF